jgi:hypothetical protein
VFGADLCQRCYVFDVRKGVGSFRKSGTALDDDGVSGGISTSTKTSFFEAGSNRPVQSMAAFPDVVQLPLHG